MKFSCSVNSWDVQVTTQPERLLINQFCSSSHLNWSSLNDFEQFHDFLNVLFCQYFTRILTDGCTKGRRDCCLVNELTSALQFYLALLITHLKFHCHLNLLWHAWTNARTWMLFYKLGFLPSLLHILPWPTRATLGKQLPYLYYCGEQPNCCLPLTQASSSLTSHSFTATDLSGHYSGGTW